jgi:ATP-dependent HslUV protease ATP-binding subunit HslU
MIEIEVADGAPMPMLDIPGQPGMETQMQGLQDLFKAFGGRTTRKRMTVAESYDLLIGKRPTSCWTTRR